MPTVTLQFNKGVFENVDAFELGNPEIATAQKNILVNDAGSLVDRPGLSRFATIGAIPVIGLYYFETANKLVAVTENRKIYSVDSAGIVTNITGSGSLAGTSRPVFAEDGTYLAMAGGGVPRTWIGTGNTAAMAGSPEASTHIFYLDGYWINFLTSDQEARIAGPTSVARGTWNSADFFQAESNPDHITAGAVLQRELYLFGPASIEIFQNVGDTSTPFQRAFALSKGIAAPYSLTEADNTLWFLDSDRRFVRLEGRTPVIISTPYDRVIRGFGTVSDCWAAKIDISGLYLLLWVFPTEERSFVFDYKSQTWSEWDGFSSGVTNRWRGNTYAFSKVWNRHFVGDFRTGVIWEMSRTNKSDGTDKRRLLLRTGYLDQGTGARKRSLSYTLHVKRGLGTPGGIEPVLQLRWRDDDKPWSNPRTVGLGFTGDTKTVVRLFNTGIYRKRQLEISMTDAAELVLNKVEEEVELLAS